MKPKTTYIIGQSIDACLYARKLANTHKIIFVKTGQLGYPYDYIGDFLYEDDVALISKILGHKVEVTELINSRYIYMPYDEIKMVNSKNGLIPYPLNKLSFESAEELDEAIDCAKGIDIFMGKLEKTTNYINAYKSFFPKWLYESIIKYVGINKWGGLRQSKLTRRALLKELDLSMIEGVGTGIIYKPVMSYEEICQNLLQSPNITIIDAKLSDMNSFIKTRVRNADVIFMDNRIDSFIGYHHGVLDRIDLSTEITSEQGMVEFIDVTDGIVITPKSSYWCATNKLGVIQKIYSSLVDTNMPNRPTVLAPTIANSKMILEYDDLLNLYSGKKLNLKRYVKSVLL